MKFKSALVTSICTVTLLGQVPQPTISPSSQPSRELAAPPVEQKQDSSDALAEAYRRQLERMTDAERKKLNDLRDGAASAPGNSLLPTTRPSGLLTPTSPRAPQAAPRETSAAGSLTDVNRSLADLDEIRDRYIQQAGNGACAPTIMMRMADLKWKLGQKGVAVSVPLGGTSERGDYVAIGADWFKAAGDAPGLELREATVEDILPQTMVGSRNASVSATADEDVNKQRSEFDALATACVAQQRRTTGREQ